MTLDNTLELALALAAATIDKKAADPVLLQVSDLVSYADYLLVVTATSRPHVEAIVEDCAAIGKAAGSPAISQEGLETGKWALVDFGDVVLHIFQPAERAYYDLETLWIEATRVDIPGAEHAESLAPYAS